MRESRRQVPSQGRHPGRPPAHRAGRGWSARRRRRFRRTVAIALVLLIGVLGAWALRPRPTTQVAAPAPSTSVPVPPAVTPAAVAVSSRVTPAAPTPGADDDQGGYHGVYGDISPRVPQHGRGTFTVLAARSAPVTVPGRVVTYSIAVEDGLPQDAGEFATAVAATLLDPRGWQAADHVRWVGLSPQQVASGTQPQIRVALASPGTVDAGCRPLQTNSAVSCFNAGTAWINAQRWVTGAYTYGKDLARYRIYLVNHEVGHGLGHGHDACPGPGHPAPVMLQQTKTLQGCVAWPYP
ncbi:DUF3152 domain-containing protein [Arsenicicoccus dermatophilus]|uniref:DUF3152 domain-containing protein n=1 Tax=Arsenicicoccus dermatophilus TaxID=1076331 RepID=UPI003916CD6B